MKKYSGKLTLTCVITLLPMIVGLILWNRLPETMATHWGANNEANGWSSREFVVFGMPVILMALHLLAVGVTMADPKKRNIGKRMIGILFWIVPVVSWFAMMTIYLSALGTKMNIGLVANILVGAVFIIVGNYLPKNRQNFSVGIKLPWTLADEENWNKTNRLSGYLFVICGFIFIVNAFFLSIIPIIATVLAVIIIPVVYSYWLYRKKIE